MGFYKDFTNDEYIFEESINKFYKTKQGGLMIENLAVKASPLGRCDKAREAGAICAGPGELLPLGRGHPAVQFERA